MEELNQQRFQKMEAKLQEAETRHQIKLGQMEREHSRRETEHLRSKAAAERREAELLRSKAAEKDLETELLRSEAAAQQRETELLRSETAAKQHERERSAAVVKVRLLKNPLTPYVPGGHGMSLAISDKSYYFRGPNLTVG